jgi:flagellin
MSSILTNASALSALQSLTQTQSALKTTEKPGFDRPRGLHRRRQRFLLVDRHPARFRQRRRHRVQLRRCRRASGAVDRLFGDQLGRRTIKSIETALTQATNPGADLGAIETTLVGLSSQLASTVNGASFNGLNVLDNSSLPASDQNATTGGTATGTGALAFVSGFNATATGGSVNTITLTTQALINGGAADTARPPPAAAAPASWMAAPTTPQSPRPTPPAASPQKPQTQQSTC